MPYALRYGLSCAILTAGIGAALYLRQAESQRAPTASERSDVAQQAPPAEPPPYAHDSTPRRPNSQETDSQPTPTQATGIRPVAGAVPQDHRTERPTHRRTISRRHSPPPHNSPTQNSHASSNAADHSRGPVRPESHRRYVVQPGDSLQEIARCHLGDPQRYYDIYRLNRDRLSGPNDLYAGMILRLPDGQATTVRSRRQPPEIDLEFSPMPSSESDDGYTIVPARRRQPTEARADDSTPQRVIPARETPYLPRAFRRGLDGPSAEIPRASDQF